jgi:glucosamine-6-phosphate deaminase
VPKYGLTVGLDTISSLSKKAILVMTGKEKKYAFKKLSFKKKFTVSWPSSIIYKCKNAKIYVDKGANINS